MSLFHGQITKAINDQVNALAKKHDKLTEQERQEDAQMLYDFLQVNMDRIKYYMAEYMRNSSVKENYVYDRRSKKYEKVSDDGYGIFDSETVRIMPKPHKDLVNKTLNLLCPKYKADRYLVDKEGKINDEQTKLLTDIYNDANIATASHEWLKQGKYFNCILVQPAWRNEKIQFDIHTPNFVTVRSQPFDRLELRELIISKVFEYKEEEIEGFVFWSKDEHYYMRKDGKEKIPVGKNGEKGFGTKNVLKALPFEAFRDKISSDFWGEPMQDLVENNIWYNISEGNIKFAEFFSSLGFLYGVNMGFENGKYTITPNNIFMVDDIDNTKQTPKMDSVRIDAPLDALRENSKRDMEAIGNSKGISGGAFTNEASEQSGVSKMFDNAELQVIRESDLEKVKDFETKLFEKVKLVYNYYTDGEKLSEDLSFKISIIKEKPTMTVGEEIAREKADLEMGLTTRVDILIDRNPDLTEEQAIKQIQRIDSINQKLKPATESEPEEKPVEEQ